MNVTTLKVEFASMKFEFAVTADPRHVSHNLSKMGILYKRISTQKTAGNIQGRLITVFGRWVVVYGSLQKDNGKDLPSMQFFDLDMDLDLLRVANEGQEELEKGIIQAMEDYRKIFNPQKHDRVRLLSDPPD